MNAIPQSKKIVVVDLRYPYGRPKPYLNGSVCTIAAVLMFLGHQVDVVDFNLDEESDPRIQELFATADIIGISVIGCPYVPAAVKLASRLSGEFPAKLVLMGGQVMAKLSRPEFAELFYQTNAVQIQDYQDLAAALGCLPQNIPSPFLVPIWPVWERMGQTRLKDYLCREFTLVLSQGCIYNCSFCAALKGMPEQHRDLAVFEADMRYLAQTSLFSLGIKKLECYASSLDFFQNPKTVVKYLKILTQIKEDTTVEFRVRCLSCMKTFLKATQTVQDLAGSIVRSGLWCIGFGVDGTDEEVWAAQKKRQNHTEDIGRCIEICQSLGVRAEILLVMGFEQDNRRTLWKNLSRSIELAWKYPNAMLRPYLYKPLIPGNEGWETDRQRVDSLWSDIERFYNLDFCTMASKLTHPDRQHRWLCNLAYLSIIGVLTPFGKCCTSPLMPQGDQGWYGRLSRVVNRLIPFDR